MAEDVFTLGDVVRRGWEVRDVAGDLAEAGDVTATVYLPDGTTAAPAVTTVSTGTYRIDYTPTVAGLHTLRWLATGDNAGSDVDTFHVRAAAWSGLVSLSEAKTELGWSGETDADEDALVAMIEAVSAACEAYTNRVWRQRTFTEALDGDGGSELILGHAPILSITSVTENGSAVAAAGYAANTSTITRLSGYAAGSWTAGVRNIAVTYVAGVADVPADVRRGVLIALAHNWRSSRGMGSATFGAYGDGGVGTPAFSLPNASTDMWRPYVLPSV